MFNAKEMEFETLSANLKSDFERYDKSEVKLPISLENFGRELKKLLKLLTEISTVGANKTAKGKETKERMKKFQQRYEELEAKLNRFRNERVELDKQLLFKGRTEVQMTQQKMGGNGDVQHDKLIKENLDIARNLEAGAEQLDQAHDNMLVELDDQRRVLDGVQRDVDTIGQDTGTVGRILRNIRNRNLINKLILLLLAVFLTLADVILLVLKI